MLIELKNIIKNYVNGDVVTKVLRSVDLSVKEGEFIAIMGPSGSGKSTLMHIIGFLDRPTSGDYFFNGENLGHFQKSAVHKRNRPWRRGRSQPQD